MTAQEKRKAGGGKLSRSETVTVRLDPQLRYLAGLAGRIHRRTLSSYIEWAIKSSVDREALRPADGRSAERTLAQEAEALWDVDEPDRFVKLALRHPYLLTHEEQVLWKLVQENGAVWEGSFSGPDALWTWTVSEKSVRYPELRASWITFCEAAANPLRQGKLPTWTRVDPRTERMADGRLVWNVYEQRK